MKTTALVLILLASSRGSLAQQPEVVATHLVVPWGLAFTPDGRIFVTERYGRVRVIDQDGLQPIPEIDLTADVLETGEGGLMGIDVDPDFLTNGYFYVMYTHRIPPLLVVNRVQRLVETSPGVAVQDEVLLDGILGASVHDGGRLKVGPDQKLWITTGTARCAAGAQDLTALDGKILRMNLDGTAPDDNPFPDFPLIYSYGHRNPQGIAWDSSGQLYATEHGPTGDCGWPGSSYDEVNIIYPGGNYGWPYCRGACVPPDPRYIDPVRYWRPASEGGEGTAAPAGAAFHPNGWLYFATLGATFTPPPLYARHVHGILFDMPGGTEIVDEAILFYQQFGRIRDVVMDPAGEYLYFSTSNRDGRSETVDPDDDRILRVRF